MKTEKLTRDQAAHQFGEDFVQMMMRGKREIEITPHQRIMIEKWKLIREMKFTPFAYEYVYMVHNGREHFKIGLTRHPKSRLAALSGSTADETHLHGLIVVSGMYGRNVERGIQAELTRRGIHHRAEWFKGKPDAWWPVVDEFARARYGKWLTTLSDAWEGCEPMVSIYKAAMKAVPHASDVMELRRDFMWVVDQAEAGLTVVP